MGEAGWSLKGPQPRLQDSLASSCTPVGLTHRSPPPPAPACLRPAGPPSSGLPLWLWGAVRTVGVILGYVFPHVPWGMGLGHEQ